MSDEKDVSDKKDATNDSVGYGRPPKRHQFKKGQSGNPKGRPRGQKSFLALLDEALDQCVPVQEAGKRKMIKKYVVGAKQFANKIASGDYRALKLLLDLQASPAWRTANESPDQYNVDSPRERIQDRINEMRARMVAAGEILPSDSAR